MIEQLQFSIILPVYNQAEHIKKTVESYLMPLEKLNQSFEIILVVNGCRDGSKAICMDLAKSNSCIRVLYNEVPGWGLAVRTGLAAANGKILCYTNSSRTSAHHIIMFLVLAVSNPGFVIKANRRYRLSLVRRIGSVLFNFECRSLFKMAVWDLNGTPKAFDRKLVDLFDLQEEGDLFDLEFLVKCNQYGQKILDFPIVSESRHSGKSTTNIKSAVKMYWGAFRLWNKIRKTGGYIIRPESYV